MDDGRVWANKRGLVQDRPPIQPRADIRQVFDKLAEGPLCPNTGRPIDEQGGPGESSAQQNARAARNASRYAAWADLSAADKTAICAFVRFAPEWARGVPRWRVGFPEMPEVEIAAQDELHAQSVYNALCGITLTNPDCKHIVTRIVSEETLP
jgi:hypothetical protein